MRNSKTTGGAFAAVALLALIAGCSQPQQRTETPQATTEEASPAPAEAPPAQAPAPASAAATAGIPLDIKDASGAQMTGNVEAGEKVFRQCLTCHVTTAGVNKVGPSLHGIIGRTAGSVPGFRYSNANKNSGITWTEQELYTYLENPRAKVPGTIMAFVGLKDSQQRADVIAYLKGSTK